MTNSAILAFISAALSALLALAVVVRGKRSAANWLFFAGMICLAIESIFDGFGLNASSPVEIIRWQRIAIFPKALLPGFWICFSLAYSRGNYREFLTRWRMVVGMAFVLPIVLVCGFPDDIYRVFRVSDTATTVWFGFGNAGKALNVIVLISLIIVLMNLEKTFRTAVGTMRWRIKFVVLGLCIIFGARIYTDSQALLYSTVNSSLLSLPAVDAGALLLGCLLIGVSYLRAGVGEIDVYPSHTFLYSSITVLLSGIYLLVVGVLARVVVALGGDTAFPLKSFFVLIGIVGLAVLLLSDRIRQKTNQFISRHFARPLYDYRKVWNLFTEKTAHATNQNTLCAATAKLVSDTFNILSVTVWLTDPGEHRLVFAGSTSLDAEKLPAPDTSNFDWNALTSGLLETTQPFDLEKAKTGWAEFIRRLNPGTFAKGGSRVCVPIVAGDQALGIIVLADRVGGVPFSLEELDLLKCIGNHVGASLLGIQLSQKLLSAKEQEAFKSVSAFFAHDLKNAASTLSLMLKNLPKHFEDPEFREDVLRGLSKTVNHMNHLIARLSVFRQEAQIRTVQSDLNDVINGALNRWESVAEIELIKQLEPIPKLALDPDQIQNVVTNLLLNARDALGTRGQIRVVSARQNGWATVTVSDNGCGISPEFLRQSLFRPFRTTKKDGTGIGMFQCKTIIEAHRGKIEVESELGKGTSFRILLPLQS
ncbi:MAG TPA: XrtA/PEP-CTERM system histidine kinase PrsK [Verrucomicrobiae bacterium]|nr:XrtA/PEP-CTERM system histidine kinase PrsK [Verrucomicrobiae bacterium]